MIIRTHKFIVPMITEDYVNFEVAKLLKEKGFDELCIFKYNYEGIRMKSGIAIDEWQNSELDYNECSCPTHQITMKWLREVHNISVRPRYDEVEDEKERLWYVWFFDILSMNPYKTLVEIEQGYSTYEEACEAAIKYCLENLI